MSNWMMDFMEDALFLVAGADENEGPWFFLQEVAEILGPHGGFSQPVMVPAIPFWGQEGFELVDGPGGG